MSREVLSFTYNISRILPPMNPQSIFLPSSFFWHELFIGSACGLCLHKVIFRHFFVSDEDVIYISLLGIQQDNSRRQKLEVGKRSDRNVLISYLGHHAAENIPRTTGIFTNRSVCREELCTGDIPINDFGSWWPVLPSSQLSPSCTICRSVFHCLISRFWSCLRFASRKSLQENCIKMCFTMLYFSGQSFSPPSKSQNHTACINKQQLGCEITSKGV